MFISWGPSIRTLTWFCLNNIPIRLLVACFTLKQTDAQRASITFRGQHKSKSGSVSDHKLSVSPRNSKKITLAKQSRSWRRVYLFTLILELLRLGFAVVGTCRHIAETSWFHSGYCMGLYSFCERPRFFWLCNWMSALSIIFGHKRGSQVTPWEKARVGVEESSLGD